MGAAAQKRMKKHIFSENKCQTLVNKNQGKEVNLTGTMSRILVNGFQIVNIQVSTIFRRDL